MELKNFEVNPFGENTYILWDCTTKEAAIVDPGMSDAHETSEVERFITSNKLHLNTYYSHMYTSTTLLASLL